ncbi:uncharacterized protein LOC101864166 [Aplysia californica]|uniref:Uncharacterized protein LOC101864166 n=1 Tax=Aplysia californica TaxID=6500 RepID=A0ABM1VXH9_APLCA|nr:uncharacterized protein LOC101864166 [Aplysia californica]
MLSTESQRASALDQVKRELRSILLSAKLGVALDEIQKDYEMLSCSRLPYRDLGFKDVQSFMRSIPDVAVEVRNPNGDTVYKAVCDESTAHIQKLVSNQRTVTKKKSKFVRGRGRGRGAAGGGFVRGRGGMTRGGGDRGRGGRGGSTHFPLNKPRLPKGHVSTRGGRLPSFSTMSSLGATDVRTKMNQQERERSSRESSSTATVSKSSIAFAFKKLETYDTSHGSSDFSSSWDVRNRRPVLGARDNGQADTSYDRWEGDAENNELNKENLCTDMVNLKIGVSKNGQRVISTESEDHAPPPGGQTRDLRAFLNEKRSRHQSAESQSSETLQDTWARTSTEGRGGWGSSRARGKGKRQGVASHMAFKQDIPPRFARQQQNGDGGSKVQAAVRTDPLTPRRTHRDENTDEGTVLYIIDNDNWEPPENGELYLRTFRDYFAQRGQRPPDIDIVTGKAHKRAGFYGRLRWNDQLYYPLEILRTEEEARQNAARSFCIENKIPLLGSKEDSKKSSSVLGDMSRETPVANFTPPWLAQSGLQSLVQTESSPTSATAQPSPSPSPSPARSRTTVEPLSPAEVPVSGPWYAAAGLSNDELEGRGAAAGGSSDQRSSGTGGCTAEVMEKLFKLLTESGLWARAIPQLYEQTYGESLGFQLTPESLEPWSDFFNVEQPITGRAVIYPILSAADKLPSLMKTTDTVSPAPNMPSLVPVPQLRLPAIGNELTVLFSFAYSAEELYLQSAESEDLVYQVDEILGQKCPNLPIADAKDVGVGGLVAAHYEGGWYRARVDAVQPDVVRVYFIDYGNREQVSLTSLRGIPHEDLVLRTQPLAWPCALRKPKNLQGPWLPNTYDILSKISETTTFVARILCHSGSSCVVDLILPQGQLVNSMLVKQEGPSQQVTSSSTVVSAAELGQQQQQQQQQETGVKEISAGTASSTVQAVTADHNRPDSDQKSNSSSCGSRRSSVISHTSTGSKSKVFADDPEPLEVPEDEDFAVYVCTVLTESSVLVRVIDAEYSDKLDDLEQQIREKFDSWPKPVEVKKTNVYACMLEMEEEEEEGTEDGEQEEEKTKYYRARVLAENKEEKTVDIYLPDHGQQEVVSRHQLREIDPKLNSSLSYQAVLANLHGLDSIPEGQRVVAAEALIHLTLTEATTFMAVRKNLENLNVGGASTVDKVLISRVRKIMSCLPAVSAETVAAVYQDVFGTPLDNVEEIIKHIPGYGFWKEGLEVELVDTSLEEDRNINRMVLDVVKAVQEQEASCPGGDPRQVLREMLGSGSLSLADTADSGDACEGAVSQVPLYASGPLSISSGSSGLNQQQQQHSGMPTVVPSPRPSLTSSPAPTPPSGGDEAQQRLDRVKDYVREQAPPPPSSPQATPGSKPKPRSAYTWTNPKLKQQPQGGAATPDYGATAWSHNVDAPTSPGLNGGPPGMRAITGNHSGQQVGSPPFDTTALPIMADSECGHLPSLPRFWEYAVQEFHEVFVLHAESPSSFVTVPSEVRKALVNMQAEMEAYFNSTPSHPLTRLSHKCLYAVRKDSMWHRAVFRKQLNPGGIQVYYPDHGMYDIVQSPLLFELPAQFYALPFLAHQMILGAIVPNTQDWSEASKFFFISRVLNKNIFAFIRRDLSLISEQDKAGAPSTDNTPTTPAATDGELSIPKPITVQLVDTTGEEDEVIDDLMCQSGYARRPGDPPVVQN